MRVKLFIDGQNFFRSLQRVNQSARIDYDALARFAVSQVNGSRFAGAHYYIGIRANLPDTVQRFLYGLELRPGYFVTYESLVSRIHTCIKCNHTSESFVEKSVDTRLSIDMVRFAALHAFDIAVLFAGDEDYVPAIQAVNQFGLETWVATWSDELAGSLRNNCFGHINLRPYLEELQPKGIE